MYAIHYYHTHLLVSTMAQQVKITPKCPIRTTLQLVGGKWKLLILFQLNAQPCRLSQLKKLIPDISEKMLVQELKFLVDSGMVVRTNFGEVPPKVLYTITPKGKAAMPLINEMKIFAEVYVSR